MEHEIGTHLDRNIPWVRAKHTQCTLGTYQIYPMHVDYVPNIPNARWVRTQCTQCTLVRFDPNGLEFHCARIPWGPLPPTKKLNSSFIMRF